MRLSWLLAEILQRSWRYSEHKEKCGLRRILSPHRPAWCSRGKGCARVPPFQGIGIVSEKVPNVEATLDRVLEIERLAALDPINYEVKRAEVDGKVFRAE
jgi:hypothetical protein